MTLVEQEFVFGYGSLIAVPEPEPSRAASPEGWVARLTGHRREWGVAMDNTATIPGYKYYVDQSGRRPDVYVAFLDIARDGAATVTGVCTPVDQQRLAQLDERERNYDRVEVSGYVEPSAGRVWAYVGSADGRRRQEEGRRSDRLVVDANYLDGVRAALAQLGPAHDPHGLAALDPVDLPALDLIRVELP